MEGLRRLKKGLAYLLSMALVVGGFYTSSLRAQAEGETTLSVSFQNLQDGATAVGGKVLYKTPANQEWQSIDKNTSTPVNAVYVKIEANSQYRIDWTAFRLQNNTVDDTLKTQLTSADGYQLSSGSYTMTGVEFKEETPPSGGGSSRATINITFQGLQDETTVTGGKVQIDAGKGWQNITKNSTGVTAEKIKIVPDADKEIDWERFQFQEGGSNVPGEPLTIQSQLLSDAGFSLGSNKTYTISGFTFKDKTGGESGGNNETGGEGAPPNPPANVSAGNVLFEINNAQGNSKVEYTLDGNKWYVANNNTVLDANALSGIRNIFIRAIPDTGIEQKVDDHSNQQFVETYPASGNGQQTDIYADLTSAQGYYTLAYDATIGYKVRIAFDGGNAGGGEPVPPARVVAKAGQIVVNIGGDSVCGFKYMIGTGTGFTDVDFKDVPFTFGSNGKITLTSGDEVTLGLMPGGDMFVESGTITIDSSNPEPINLNDLGTNEYKITYNPSQAVTIDITLRKREPSAGFDGKAYLFWPGNNGQICKHEFTDLKSNKKESGRVEMYDVNYFLASSIVDDLGSGEHFSIDNKLNLSSLIK